MSYSALIIVTAELAGYRRRLRASLDRAFFRRTKLEKGLKIAVTGKGGVGKTTLSALLAREYARRGQRVLAIDADPAPCLGGALAIPESLLDQLQPISEMDSLIAERTGAQPGEYGGFFKLNPRVDDLPERFSAIHEGVRLLELGGVEMGGSGCICPESTILRALITHVVLYRDEVVIIDLYAGVEHLGRATADAVDAMLIVVEPTRRSLGTADQIRSLAEDIGLDRLYLVGSKVQGEADLEFIRNHSGDLPLIGSLPFDPKVREADRRQLPLYQLSPEIAAAARNIADSLESQLQ